MTQQAQKLEKKRGRLKLQADSDTVFLGIKMPKELKDDFEDIAFKMGLSPSRLVRILMANFVENAKTQNGD